MLPANLAKTRAAGRGAYGELLMLNPAAAAAAAALPPGVTAASSLAANPAAAYRYTPYPLPTAAAAAHHSSATVPAGVGVGVGLHAAMVPIAMAAPSGAAGNPACLQYTPTAAATTLYNMAGAVQAAATCKRAFAATAAALRPHHTPATALTYSMSDLLGVQGLDVSAMYHPAIPAAVGL